MSDLEIKACDFAIFAHEHIDQRRKYTGERSGEWKPPVNTVATALQARIAELEELLNTKADVLSAGHRLALELECLLLDTKDLSVVSKWWDAGMAALDTWRALLQENPRYTAPPASSQLLAAVKEVIAAEEEARMGAPEIVAHEVKRDVVSRRLNAWGALHAAAEAITEEEYVALTEEEAQQEERTPGMAPEFGADYGLDQKREAEEQFDAAYRGGAVKAAVRLTDKDFFAIIKNAYIQQYAGGRYTELKAAEEASLRANGLLPATKAEG